MKNLLCKDLKQIDLVDYLARLGHEPAKIRNNDYWYLSPLRNENEPSFKVNRKMNVWYDHGLGKGGDLIEFGKLYYNCCVKELLQILNDGTRTALSFRQQFAAEKKTISGDEGKIMINNVRIITDPALRQYLHDRGIPLVIANRFCSEVEFILYDKKHVAIGFKNNLGGYELRNQYFKGSCSPKYVTFLNNNSEQIISVFEGFFDFLSFQTNQLTRNDSPIALPKVQGNFLILNSISFFERSKEIMETYQHIHLFLDHDPAGLKWTKHALEWSCKYKDESIHYRQFKDLNEWLINSREKDLELSRKGILRL
jgi:hypothetical protein